MPLLVIALIVVPLLELWVILQVGGWLGVLNTIGLLLLMSLIGAALLGSQGRAAWREFMLALSEGRVPAKEIANGAIVIFGGALLLTPGFLTDAVGLACLVPPSRAAIRRGLTRLLMGRVTMVRGARVAWERTGRGPASGRPGYDYEGTAREVTDEERLPSDTGEPSGSSRPQAPGPGDPGEEPPADETGR